MFQSFFGHSELWAEAGLPDLGLIALVFWCEHTTMPSTDSKSPATRTFDLRLCKPVDLHYKDWGVELGSSNSQRLRISGMFTHSQGPALNPVSATNPQEQLAAHCLRSK